MADDFRVGFKEVSGRTANKAYNDTMQSILKIASRTARDSAAASELVGMGGERNIIGKIEHAWLTQEEFLELRELMMRVKLYMDARKARREGRLYLAAVIAMPVTRKRGAKRNGADAKSGPKSAPKSAPKSTPKSTPKSDPKPAAGSAPGSDAAIARKPRRKAGTK